MDDFEIDFGGDFIRLRQTKVYRFPESTCYWGGYEAEGNVEIQMGHYHVLGHLWYSTGEVWKFYTELTKAYKDLAGQARFRTFDGSLEFLLTFALLGHVVLEGSYQEKSERTTKLVFESQADQSYLPPSLSQLAEYVSKYGDNYGILRKREAVASPPAPLGFWPHERLTHRARSALVEDDAGEGHAEDGEDIQADE